MLKVEEPIVQCMIIEMLYMSSGRELPEQAEEQSILSLLRHHA